MMRRNWLRSFSEDQKIYIVRRNDAKDLILFKTHTTGRDPMYHVWLGDNWLFCGPNYLEAEHAFESQFINAA